MPINSVAIIGAGLAGLPLALFLHRQGLDVTIYELRRADAQSEGAVVISPNALRTLDALGLYKQIKAQGYSFRDVHFESNEHQPLGTYELGNAERYGYDALRVYRQILLATLKHALDTSGVKILYEHKFSHVVSDAGSAESADSKEPAQGVTFAFADGTQHTADLLIGADGIHSRVRRHLYPSLEPSFAGAMAVTGAIPTAALRLPSPDFAFPSSTHGSAGACVIAPQDPDASEALVGVQYRTHARDRAGWDALNRDKEGLLRFFRESYAQWNPMVQSAMDAVPVHTTSIWPFYTVPTLESWVSQAGKGRVLVVGDAAHAIPPAAGQGVNQAFEDAHSLSLIIEVVNKRELAGANLLNEWQSAVQWWQRYRLHRIKGVIALTDEMSRRRLPGWDGKGEPLENSWLYSVQIPRDVENWAKSC